MRNNSIKSKLQSLDSYIISGSPKKQKPIRNSGNEKLAKRLSGEIISNFAGSFCLVNTVFEASYVHGLTPLSVPLQTRTIPLSACKVEDNPETIDIGNLLFIDTETTGLGGTGAVAFLIGVGVVEQNSFVIRQYLIPDYSDETAMLEALLEEFSDEKTLVSYNGAAFDLPLISDRMIINRVGRKIDQKYHLDLLPVTRRIFRRRLADCSLTNIEREVLGFYRSDDIPGYLIPSVYFEWLSGENLDLLPDVLEHNRFDIISMFFLIERMAGIERTKGETLEHVDDIHSLSRLQGRRKKREEVSLYYERMIEIEGENLSPDLLLFHALNFKRQGQFERALNMWEKLSELKSREGFSANIELAVYFEHRAKNPKKALIYAEKAIACDHPRGQKEPLNKRLERLRKKSSIS